ncbi:hypothetical protein SAMN05421821_105169 [Mucilaginibacter lappiensis]|uniref:Uncharacterized protein n=1 Tax=Mucilaginibacter lappiensis TaxID=354630 RepID=A0ABR6PIZ5_9SPHI|nr:hypothetical protein [Mucilaginibacter lappiensis]MBB6109751.1 hypothetical protein [Mucilaginibacter lappiensis]SIR14274.1 hypothetical protein SAMN05421821_105169 [Mucilaginibacter lappiensis]
MTPQQLLKRNAEIIERYIGMKETPSIISNTTGISVSSIEAIINLYCAPVIHEMIMQSKVNYGFRDWFIYNNWNKLAIQQMAEVLACSTLVIKRRAKFLKLGKKQKVALKKVRFNYRARVIVLNQITGIYYFSNNEAADSIGMNRSTFKGKISGQRSNDTFFLKLA